MSSAPTVRLVLGDQLTRSLSSLTDLAMETDIVLMAEVRAEATYVKHHKKKIAFLFSAMRHFAARLEAEGIRVAYVRHDDPDNGGSLLSEVRRIARDHDAERIVVTEPGEYRLREDMDGWTKSLNIPVEIREDSRFIATLDEFNAWADGRKSLRMEFFYREMRRKTGILMEKGGEPTGGQWNFDADNRESLPETVVPPERLGIEPDTITSSVLMEVEAAFPDHFGDLEPFDFAVTAEDAETLFDHFLKDCLPLFGTYQDAMKGGDPYLFHSLIGQYLNAGLLDPLACCEGAETQYRKGKVPLNAAEGFIRQILGWREFVRGIYWREMPDYKERNTFGADRPLPDFFWTGETRMACLRDVVQTTKANAYAHHIQRLMITGNFALLAGLSPEQVNEWYLIVYADAYEWVQLPNTHGMALYADGGLLASKPYAASGAYINRMSNYCKSCHYKVSKKNGAQACPFNYLYWNFLIENEEHLKDNPRIAMPYRTLAKMDPERRDAVKEDAARFFRSLKDESGAKPAKSKERRHA
ncbi:MAG: cryptochrome/photolyase family protein [Alphaproteobacteria bacterium]